MEDGETRKRRDSEFQPSHPGVCEPLDSPVCSYHNKDIEGCTTSADNQASFGFNCPSLHSNSNGVVKTTGILPLNHRNIYQLFNANNVILLKLDCINISELRFPRTNVPIADTSYYCRTFKSPERNPQNIIAIENLLDNVNVVHHIMVFACKIENYPTHQFDSLMPCGLVNNFCRHMIYAWKIGIEDRCLAEDNGILFGGDSYNTFVLQVHWNNPELHSDEYDSSGVRIYYSPVLRPHFEQVALLMQGTIDIPPLTKNCTFTSTCPGYCIGHNTFITTMFLHMHSLGQSGQVQLFRNGTLYKTLVEEDNYDVVKPKFFTFNPAIKIYSGDDIKVTCQYNSLDGIKRREGEVHGGFSASEEMCIAFTTYYPNTSAFSCIQYGENTSPCHDTRSHTKYSAFHASPIDITEYKASENMEHGEFVSENNAENHPLTSSSIHGYQLSDRERQLIFLKLFTEK